MKGYMQYNVIYEQEWFYLLHYRVPVKIHSWYELFDIYCLFQVNYKRDRKITNLCDYLVPVIQNNRRSYLNESDD